MASREQTHKDRLEREGEDPHPHLHHKSNPDPKQAETGLEGGAAARQCDIDWMAYNLDPRKAVLVPILGAVIGLLAINLTIHVHPFVNAVLFIGMAYIMRVVGNMLQLYGLAVHYEAFQAGELGK